MHRLAGRFKGERALVVFGGPSILENRLDLSRFAGRGFVTFLEAKALTPRFLEFGVPVDFYLMLYPEKSKANSFQGVIVQAILANIGLKDLVREDLHGEVDALAARFDDYFEPGKANIAHKRYRWRPDVYLEGSPFSLLSALPDSALISFVEPYAQFVRNQKFAQTVHLYDMETERGRFDLDQYFHPTVKDGRLVIKGYPFSNSAAIALFPLLNFMGFAKVYFLGMDMSMLGSMEYAAPYTFRSMDHFATFFEKARKVFSAQFPRSERQDLGEEIAERIAFGGLGRIACAEGLALAWRWLAGGRASFMRPRREFRSLAAILAYPRIEFVNVHAPYRYAHPIAGIRNVDFAAVVGV